MPIRRLPLAAGLLATLLVAAQPGLAQTAPADDEAGQRRYVACMDLTRSDPRKALEQAIGWSETGGGDPAEHCAAVSLVALGQFTEAALKLERLAENVPPRMQPDLLAQAAQAWMLDSQPDKAYAAQTRALGLNGRNVELWIDRAVTLANQQKYWEAIDDLNAAHDLAPNRPDILIYRAAAYRYVEVPDLARDDIDRALTLAPGNPEGLLERGILKRLAGDNEGAREDWLTVLRSVPDSPAAAIAQRNLEKMDVETGG